MTDGLVVVDKPAGWTSHDVVAKVRGIFGQRRVGHSGTLDPGATGVLLVGLGRVTRLLRYLTALPKSYEGEVVLGVATSTLDDAGTTLATWDMGNVTLDDVRAAAAGFVGAIEQVPPMVSAIQIQGRRLHDLAREGIEIERPSRSVVVHRFDVVDAIEPGVFGIAVACSSGTYVRSLAADLGTALGGGAHLRALRRTAIGSFCVDEAHSLADLAAGPEAAVLSPLEALRDYPSFAVDDDGARAVGHGRPLDPDAVSRSGAGPWAVIGPDDALLAVYEDARGALRPVVVLAR